MTPGGADSFGRVARRDVRNQLPQRPFHMRSP